MFGGFPFEHFGHQDQQQPPPPPQDIDTTKLYETLNINKDATETEIKKAYRRLAKIHHPDKGGDEHKFKEINAAYKILKDEDKRRAYDRYGLDGVNDDEHSRNNGNRDDLFNMFFPGRGGSNKRRAGPRKGPSLNHPLNVSLEEAYTGKTVKLAVTRKVIVGETKTCIECDGNGVKVEVRQIGPGMVQQMQTTCSKCKGQGCTAEQKSEKKILEVHIQPGTKQKQKIQFKGMGDELPNMEAGDVNFIVNIKEHPIFKRNGADLLVHKELSLNQALCGFSLKITHLDGREILIKSKSGEVIKPNAGTEKNGTIMPFVKSIPNEGMPSLGNPFVRGNLYIVFNIVFPHENELSQDQIKILKEILPDPDMDVEYDSEIVEEVHMTPADLRNFGRGGAEVSSNSEYDSDEEGPGHVQCQQS